MAAPERPSKQDAFLALLREGWTSLHLDARRPGVIVPAHLRGDAHLPPENVFDVEARAAKRRDSTDRLLRAVPDDAVLEEPLSSAPPRRRRPQLRLVK